MKILLRSRWRVTSVARRISRLSEHAKLQETRVSVLCELVKRALPCMRKWCVPRVSEIAGRKDALRVERQRRGVGVTANSVRNALQSTHRRTMKSRRDVTSVTPIRQRLYEHVSLVEMLANARYESATRVQGVT